MAEAHLQSIRLERATPQRLEALEVTRWPVWEKEVSEFPWQYAQPETCYFLEGRVEIVSAEGMLEVGKGDLVTFPQGLQCTWRVKAKVKKQYRNG